MANHRFVAPWPKLAGALIVVLVIAALALRLPSREVAAPTPRTAHAPSPWLVAAAAFVGASLFMGVHQLYSAMPELPGIVPVAVTV